jgi:TonB family protein
MRRSMQVVIMLLTTSLPPLAAQDFAPADTMPICEGVGRGRFATILADGESRGSADTSSWTPRIDLGPAGLRPRNPESVRLAMIRYYPPPLRSRRVSGEVLVMARIDEQGRVVGSNVLLLNGDPDFAPAANTIVRVMRFVPVLYQGCRIPVLLRVPVVFRPD